MGSYTTFYIGPYLKIKKGLTVSETVLETVCPKCKTKRDTKYCAVCGTEIETHEKINKQRYTFPYDIACVLAPGTEDEIDEVISSFNYGPEDVFIPNYNSEYTHSFDRDDVGKLVSSNKIFNNADIGVAELRTKLKSFIILMDQNDIVYEFGHGVIVGAY